MQTLEVSQETLLRPQGQYKKFVMEKYIRSGERWAVFVEHMKDKHQVNSTELARIIGVHQPRISELKKAQGKFLGIKFLSQIKPVAQKYGVNYEWFTEPEKASAGTVKLTIQEQEAYDRSKNKGGSLNMSKLEEQLQRMQAEIERLSRENSKVNRAMQLILQEQSGTPTAVADVVEFISALWDKQEAVNPFPAESIKRITELIEGGLESDDIKLAFAFYNHIGRIMGEYASFDEILTQESIDKGVERGRANGLTI